ncbi:MAG: urease accessory protein UreD [Rubrivivax sp.]|nr:urease accessory protein UreD [Betaproteobacteria bacterium]MBP6320009.1 urease accessory protein UreD [Rubrivivax sp.]MBK7277169.1 urease accessory protein UreD [Betaproteobacteria bacterium]MBK7461140.1 urease accessory protein UreD [Betaproteobacteria bacterium]MBK7515868.1 urease accessory protein UreD [Betaproteobacteria bacterium]
MSWHGRLALHYRREGGRTTALDRHHGPLRVLQRLYPEGPGICHHVLVHPPGGMVGGDRLEIEATLEAGAHALVTTPSATRYYRSTGAPASQQALLRVAAGARLEWLPLETLAYRGCHAHNGVQLHLAPGAEAMGWDVLALGLPAAGRPFDSGRFHQHLELSGVWLERGTIDATDRLLLDSPLGLAGHRVLATMWWAEGDALAPARRQALLDSAREVLAAGPLHRTAGATAPQPRVVVVRLLTHGVEPVLHCLMAVRAAWRRQAWALAPNPPRIWRF